MAVLDRPEDSSSKNSGFSMNYKKCPRCGATWINGEHRWSNGNVGSERTLSNLVCKSANDDRCINPQKKTDSYWLGYDTWEKRKEFYEKITGEMNERFS